MFSTRPAQDRIAKKITEAFAPVHIAIENDSHKHAHHEAMEGNTNPETHFKLMVVSDAFVDKQRIECHRMINAVLAEELDLLKGGSVHALQIKAKSVAQWEKEV